jgi:hypothetical protein
VTYYKTIIVQSFQIDTGINSGDYNNIQLKEEEIKAAFKLIIIILNAFTKKNVLSIIRRVKLFNKEKRVKTNSVLFLFRCNVI